MKIRVDDKEWDVLENNDEYGVTKYRKAIDEIVSEMFEKNIDEPIIETDDSVVKDKWRRRIDDTFRARLIKKLSLQ